MLQRISIPTPSKPNALQNRNNSCYFNVLIQTLLICDDFNRYLLTKKQEGQLFNIYKSLYISFLKRDETEFNKVFVELKTICNANGRQQDTHEFLVMFVNKLHQELKEPFTNSPITYFQNKKLNVFFNKSISNVYKNDYSCISNFFSGQILTVYTCQVCQKQSLILEKFRELVLSISGINNLTEGLQSYFGEETIPNFSCNKCKKKQNGTKNLFLFSAPEYLFIVFSRYSHSTKTNGKYVKNIMIKNKQFIDYDELINLKDYCIYESPNMITKYILKSIINHEREMENGHYYSMNKYPSSWFRCNDVSINSVKNLTQIHKQNTYILMYQKKK